MFSNPRLRAKLTISSLSPHRSVFVSSFAFEGYDRDDLSLFNDGDRLIETVASHCAETVVVIHSPGPVLMERWVSSTLISSSFFHQLTRNVLSSLLLPQIDHENVTAVMMAYYPGQESVSRLPHSSSRTSFRDTSSFSVEQGNAVTNVLFGDVSPSGKVC